MMSGEEKQWNVWNINSFEHGPCSLLTSAWSSSSQCSPNISSASFCLSCCSSSSSSPAGTTVRPGTIADDVSWSHTSLSRAWSWTSRSCSLLCCCRICLNTSSLEEEEEEGTTGSRKETGEALGSGEARGDGDQALLGLVLLGCVEGPRLKVSAFWGSLRLSGSGSDGLGRGRILSLLCVSGPSLRLGPVLRRVNWTSPASCPSWARCWRGQSSAISCLSVPRTFRVRR